jgi:hypothetical protein
MIQHEPRVESMWGVMWGALRMVQDSGVDTGLSPRHPRPLRLEEPAQAMFSSWSVA